MSKNTDKIADKKDAKSNDTSATKSDEKGDNGESKVSMTLAEVQAFMEKHNVNVAFYRQRKGQGIRVQVNTRKAEGRPGDRIASEASPDLAKAMSKAIREAKRELEA